MAKGRALTAAQVTALKSHGVHWVAPSLYVQVRPQGTRSWLFRFTRDGQNNWRGLGACADKPLTEARDEAALLRVQIRRGEDPFAGQRAAQTVAKPKKNEVPTFAECAATYIATHRSEWRNAKHIDQWESTLRTYAGPVIGTMAVNEVSVDHVLSILEPIWTSKPETASRLRGRIEKVLGWATAKKFRVGDNPADKNGPLGHLLASHAKVKVEHRKAVPYCELPGLMSQLAKRDNMSAKALMFTILTAARTGETIGAIWSEFDLNAKCWNIPADRMKAHREHIVPLSDQTMALLEALPRDGDFVFLGGRPKKGLSNMAMLQMLQAIRESNETVHGFRAAFSTWAREQTDYPREIVEASLAHATGNAVELAYRRTTFLEKRRELMQAWSHFVLG